MSVPAQLGVYVICVRVRPEHHTERVYASPKLNQKAETKLNGGKRKENADGRTLSRVGRWPLPVVRLRSISSSPLTFSSQPAFPDVLEDEVMTARCSKVILFVCLR